MCTVMALRTASRPSALAWGLARPYARKAKDSAGIDKNSSVTNVMDSIDKTYGAGAIMKLGGGRVFADGIESVIPTGSLMLDKALGVGGLPRGRITEIYGPESSGKTTLALHVVAEAQKLGGSCTFIDAEHALDPIYCKGLGVDTDNLFVSQPSFGEQALEICDTLVKSNTMDVVVVDSVAALVPKSELEGQIGDHHVGAQARMMSQAMRIIGSSLSGSKTVLIFINQIRHKIGVMFGSPEVTSGGNALKFYASVRLDIRKIATHKKGEEATGNQVRVTVAKNKVAPPFQKAIFDIEFGKGISTSGELLDMGVNEGFVTKGGAWYTYGGETAQGRDKFKILLEEKPELAQRLDTEIRTKLFGGLELDPKIAGKETPAVEGRDKTSPADGEDAHSADSSTVKE